MIPVWWSVALTVLGGLGWLLVAVERRLAGFLVGLAAQVAWISYAVTTAQWGFIGSALLFGAINALGLWRLRLPVRERNARAAVEAAAAQLAALAPHRAFCSCRDRPGAHEPAELTYRCPSDGCGALLTIDADAVETKCPSCGCTIRARMRNPTPRS